MYKALQGQDTEKSQKRLWQRKKGGCFLQALLQDISHCSRNPLPYAKEEHFNKRESIAMRVAMEVFVNQFTGSLK